MADKWQAIEEEMKLLKNEIKQVLIDIKEKLDTAGAMHPGAIKVVAATPEKAPAEAPCAAVKLEPASAAPTPVSSGNGNGHGKAAEDILEAAGELAGMEPHNGNGNGKAREVSAASPKAARPASDAASLAGKPAADLLTVAMLSQWLANGVKKVGRQRMEALLDIYGQLGGLSAPLKDSLMKLLNTDDGDGQAMREGISLLVEVDNLMHRSLTDRSEAAILSLFLNGNGKEAYHR